MSKVRLYIRSIHRSFLNQRTIFTDIKNLLQNLLQITEKKQENNKILSSSKAKLERKREQIDSGIYNSKNTVINFLR